MDAKAKLWIALTELPKPVTKEDVMACAQTMLQGVDLSQFIKWSELNEAYLLGRLNG